MGRKIINGNAEVSESSYKPKKHAHEIKAPERKVDSAKRDTLKRL